MELWTAVSWVLIIILLKFVAHHSVKSLFFFKTALICRGVIMTSFLTVFWIKVVPYLLKPICFHLVTFPSNFFCTILLKFTIGRGYLNLLRSTYFFTINSIFRIHHYAEIVAWVNSCDFGLLNSDNRAALAAILELVLINVLGVRGFTLALRFRY